MPGGVGSIAGRITKMIEPDRKALMRADLTHRILTLALWPGADLDETKLAEMFGLSRPPVREVLRVLAGEGYVELRANRSARVASMSHTTLRDFFLVAPMIYGAVARLAARNGGAGRIGELREVQAGFHAAAQGGDPEACVAFNDRFHALIGEMADNAYLRPSLRRLLIDHARIGATFYRPETPAAADDLASAARQHDEIASLIEARDEDGAEALAIAHWEISRRRIEAFVHPASLAARLGPRAPGEAPGEERAPPGEEHP